VVLSVVAQLIIVTFLTNENVKRAETLKTHREQFGDETLSRTQVYDCDKSFKGRPNRCEDYTFCRKSYGQRFFGTPKASYSLTF
jgi:hypothetical protein